MKEYPWSGLLNETDLTVIEKGGYGKKRNIGKKPVLIINDLQPYFIGLDRPLIEQAAEYPLGGGEKAWRCVERILSFRDAMRDAGIPIMYTRTVHDNDALLSKVAGAAYEPRLLSSHPDSALLGCVNPAADEMVILKSRESAFYGTPLESYLVTLGADTVLIAGTSTSGSCRATGVDAITRTYRLVMVGDCLTERFESSHKTALLDVWMKFGDVMTAGEVIEEIGRLKA